MSHFIVGFFYEIIKLTKKYFNVMSYIFKKLSNKLII